MICEIYILDWEMFVMLNIWIWKQKEKRYEFFLSRQCATENYSVGRDDRGCWLVLFSSVWITLNWIWLHISLIWSIWSWSYCKETSSDWKRIIQDQCFFLRRINQIILHLNTYNAQQVHQTNVFVHRMFLLIN